MTYPFVKFKRYITQDIASSPLLIFGDDQHLCKAESLIITNTTEEICKVTIYCLADFEGNFKEKIFTQQILEDQSGGYIIQKEIMVSPFGRIDILQGTSLTLEPGDLLFAYSQASFITFNTWINYKEFQQIEL